MSDQPEALRLAEILMSRAMMTTDQRASAAAELHRLVAENKALKKTLKESVEYAISQASELRILNSELVEALREALPALEAAWYNESEAHRVRTALAKVGDMNES